MYGDDGAEPTGADGFARRGVVREACTPGRLLDQTSFFLHRMPAKMPETHRDALRELHEADDVLRGRNVLIVDDDMRNIFALTSLLEDRGMNVLSDETGAMRSRRCADGRTSTSC